MEPSLQARIDRAQALMPTLTIEHVERNAEGLINDVLIINRHYVFRFIRDARYAATLATELRLLDLLRPHISLSLPTPLHRAEDCVVYPLIHGEPLTRARLQRLAPSARTRIGAQLGEFLHQLHGVAPFDASGAIPATRAPVTRAAWLDIRQRVEEKVYPLLLPHQVRWATDLFDSLLTLPNAFDFTPVVIHGDLAAYHILFDAHTDTLTGVLDFGVAGRGDAASDFGNLLTTYGEPFVQLLRATYPALDTYLPRARFYAQALELEWVLLGLESGEQFWFTAHLGGARALGP